MAILSFDQFLKKAQGTKKDVQVIPARPLGVNRAMVSQQDIIKQKQAESEAARVEAEKQSSPLGFAKNIASSLGEMSGITPTARRIAASAAPYTIPQEELPSVVGELAGGVNEPRRMSDIGKGLEKIGVPENIAEGIDVAADLPLISLGLSKSVATALEKQAIKTAPELAKFLARPLSEFAPDFAKRLLQADVSAPVKAVKNLADDAYTAAKDLRQNIRVALAEKTVSPQLKASSERLAEKTATPTLQPLAQEARKYESAEEFIKDWKFTQDFYKPEFSLPGGNLKKVLQNKRSFNLGDILSDKAPKQFQDIRSVPVSFVGDGIKIGNSKIFGNETLGMTMIENNRPVIYLSDRLAGNTKFNDVLGHEIEHALTATKNPSFFTSAKSEISATTNILKRNELAKSQLTDIYNQANKATSPFLEGTKRLENPLQTYDSFLEQTKKSLVDIKQDPAVGIVGNRSGDAFKKVVQQRKEIGKVMGDELKKIGGIKTEISDVRKGFKQSLTDSDLNFDGTDLIAGKTSKMTKEDVDLVEGYIKEFNKLKSTPTIAEVDAFIARSQSNVKNFKSAKGMIDTTNGERLIKNNLAQLRETFNPKIDIKTGKALRPKLLKYYNARKAYSELSDFLDEGAGFFGKLTQAGDFAKDASVAKSAVQSILNNGKKDFLIKLEELTGYPAMDEAVLALQAMKDAGDFRGLSLLQTFSDSGVPASKAGITQKIIDYGLEKGKRIIGGTPEQQTKAFLSELMKGK